MKQNVLLTITSLLSILLLTLHVTDNGQPELIARRIVYFLIADAATLNAERSVLTLLRTRE